MPKFRFTLMRSSSLRSLARAAASCLLMVLALITRPSCWLLVGVLHARQFGIRLASLSAEPLSTFAWHQALVAAAPWGSLILAEVAEELRSFR